MQECSIFSTILPAFILFKLLGEGHSDWCEVIAHCSFGLHFSNNKRCWASFMRLLAKCMSSLEKCLFKSVCHLFLLGCLFFWYWVVWAACIFWKSILRQLFHLRLFSPILKLSFHLAYSFLCCAKAFKFNQVSLVYFWFYSITLGGGS